MNVAERIRDQFQRLPKGGVIASRALHRLSADSQQVDKAVSRLYKAEGLEKLRNGLFYRPYVSRFFGALPPREQDIIRAVKKQYNAKVAPSGALAAYELGLINTLPDTISYDTDKRIAPIELANNTIHFRQIDGKKLSTAPGTLYTLLKALEFIYKENTQLNARQQKRVLRALSRYSPAQINKALIYWPHWLREKVQSLTQSFSTPYITGLSALNIPYQGKQADWHQMGMLNSNKFQIAGKNYDSAPGLKNDELFDCSDFLKKFNVDVGTTRCATPLRAIKDILYTNIIKKQQYPNFFMLDQYMLDIPRASLIEILKDFQKMTNRNQQELLTQWAKDNELN